MLRVLVKTFRRRLLLASILWMSFWPILSYLKTGDITGYKYFFWLVGELNYPIAAIIYVFLDRLLSRFGWKPALIFFTSIVVVALSVPLYYHRFGFPLAVYLDAYIF